MTGRRTALRRYAHLEAPGLWTEGPDAPPRDVVLRLGEATLLIADGDGTPRAQWSLPAVRRVAPGRYAPGDDGESVAVEDADMAAALDTVAAAVGRSGRRARRAPLWIAGAALLAGLAMLGGPPLLRAQAAAAMSDAQRARLSDALIAQWGTPCARLVDEVVIVRPGPGGLGATLPDRRLALPAARLAQDGAAVARDVAALRARDAGADPLSVVLAAAEPGELLRLLTTAQVPAAAVVRGADALGADRPAAAQDAPPLPEDQVARARRDCGVERA